MSSLKALLLAVSVASASPSHAQQAPTSSPSPPPEKVIEGATPDRVAQVERCQGHKFESRVEIDPVRKRSTSVKLCANPGASDADWVKTLEAAVLQIEQRNMPPEAREKLIGELRSEIAKFAAVTSIKPPPVRAGAEFITDPGATASPSGTTDRFETSVLPPLPTPRRVRNLGTATVSRAGAAVSVPPPAPVRVALKCLERGESGGGATCDFLESNTLLVIRAIEGLDGGGTLRFRRRGEVRGDIALAPMTAGQVTRVRLPLDVCRGVANTSVDIELLGPGSSGTVAGRVGRYDVRC